MPSSAVRTFTDPDDYAAAIRGTRAELTVTGRGHFAAKLIRIDLHRLWMQRFSDNLPRIAHSAAMTGRAIISFRTEPGPSLLWGGAGNAADQHHTTQRGREHLSAFIRVRLLWRHVAAGGGHGFRRGGDCRMRPDAAAICADRHPATRRDGEAPAAARGGRATGGRRPRSHCPSRGSAQSRTGVDRGHGRLPRHGGQFARTGWPANHSILAIRSLHHPSSIRLSYRCILVTIVCIEKNKKPDFLDIRRDLSLVQRNPNTRS